jgi:hypothetical protein
VLLALSLHDPPWEDLYELSREELLLTNLNTAEISAQRGGSQSARDRLASSATSPSHGQE